MDALNWYEEAVKTGALMEADGVGGHVGALSTRDFENITKKEYLMNFLMEALAHLSLQLSIFNKLTGKWTDIGHLRRSIIR